MIKDSGNRTEFESGAVRDIQDDKGRCDLMPLGEIDAVIGMYSTMELLDGWTPLTALSSNQNYYLAAQNAIISFCMLAHKDIYTVLLETSMHYREGAEKYGERNWERGIPAHSFLDSGVRHYLKWRRGDNDERHDRAFVWNMLGLMWTLKNKPEMDDLWRG